jgi:hypothetical protein
MDYYLSFQVLSFAPCLLYHACLLVSNNASGIFFLDKHARSDQESEREPNLPGTAVAVLLSLHKAITRRRIPADIRRFVVFAPVFSFFFRNQHTLPQIQVCP